MLSTAKDAVIIYISIYLSIYLYINTYLGADAGCTHYWKEAVSFLGNCDLELGEQARELVLVLLWGTNCVYVYLQVSPKNVGLS